ncbi:MAG: redoxin domain-containing protein [Cytophagales bacterium]|nr:redoxin domain-containing protein [Armatimonadota bacterium]
MQKSSTTVRAASFLAITTAAVAVSGIAFAGSRVSGKTSLPAANSAPAPASLVGQSAPAFSLPDQNDKPRSLAEAKGKWVVMAFYPKDETTGCTLQNKSYSTAKEKFGTQNAVFYTVSTQDSASKRAFCAKDALTHTLLADVGGTVAKEYGVYMTDNGLARRVTFYIAPDGKVADVDQSIRVATAAEDSLKRLAALRTSYKSAVPAGASAPATKAVAGPPKIGQVVPQFSLANPATGATQSLQELSKDKKATVLIFVATQCPVSNAYNTRMAQLTAAYADKEVQFVGINSNKQESATEVVSHAKKNGLTFPILKDPGNKVADQYEASVTPEVFVLDASGKLAFHGPIDDSQDASAVKQQLLRDALDSLTQGRSVVIKGARAFGCSIKRVPVPSAQS